MDQLKSLLNIADVSKNTVQARAKSKQEEAKKQLGVLSDVADTSASVTKAIAQKKAFPLWFGAVDKIQNLANIPKMTVDSSPFKFDNLLWQSQGWIPNLGFTQMWTQKVEPQQFTPSMPSITQDAQMIRDDAVSRMWTVDDKVLKIMDTYNINRNELFDLWKFTRQRLEEAGEDTTWLDDVDIAEYALDTAPEEEKQQYMRSWILGSLQWAGIEWAEEQAQAKARQESGQQGILSTKLQNTGAGIWWANDLIWDAVVWWVKAIWDIVTWGNREEFVNSVTEKIKDTPLYNDYIKEWLSVLWQGMEQYNQWKQENPVAWANTDALLNVVDLWLNFVWWWVAKKAGQEALESGIVKAGKEWLETAVSTVGKMKIPEVNMPSMKVPKAVSNKVDMVIEQLEWVWKAKKEWIQNNPYSKEIYSKVIDDIDNGNAPQNYKDMQEPYTKKVVEELDTILDDVKSQKWEWGEAFNLLRQDQTPIDTTVEIKSMNDLLKWTDYNLKTFLNRVDKWNLLGTRKILDNTATISTLHDIRKWLDDLMLKAQANKDSWEFKILKDMRKIVDGKLKENPDRVKADEEWARISKDIQEIEEGITYREQRKKWQIRDNIDSIIENINNPAKAKLRERLLQYMPDIWERISAIRGIPEIAKAYTTIPQWVIGRTAGALWWVAIWSTGWIPWMILWWIAWMFADVWLSQLRRNAIKKAIAKQSPKALEKLWEIQKAIADGKKLRAEQVIELQNFTNNLKKSLPANDKELINKVSELPKVMKTSLVPVKEWALESRWYTQKLTSPKRDITEINPTAWKTYTARDILEEMRAKKNKSNVSSKIDTIKAKDNQNIAVNKTEALKKELKWVKSDTLVSKSDSMSNKNIIKDTPKTIEVWIKSKFSDKWSYKEVPVIRKVENTTLYQWWSDWKRQFWTTDKKYAEQFWKVQSKKWDFYQVDNGNRVIDVYVEAKPSIWEKLDSLKANKELQPLYDEAKIGKAKELAYNYTKTGAGEKVMPLSKQKEVSDNLKYLPENKEKVYAWLTLDTDFIYDNLYDWATFESKRLLSSSTDLSIAESFADFNPNNKNKIILEIDSWGYDVSDVSRYWKDSLQREKEILFPIWSKFKVEKVEDWYYKLRKIREEAKNK